MAGPLLTIGYGSRSIEDVIAVLRQYGIQYLIDVRSAPWSRYKPEFSHDALRDRLRAERVVYAFLGEELGGRPDDPTCYDADGRVDYAACRQRPAFAEGIARVHSGWEQGHRIALLCSEGKPEMCHRSKLIAPALLEADVELRHIDEQYGLVTQEEVMARLDDGQGSLFPDVPPRAAVRSRRRHMSEEH